MALERQEGSNACTHCGRSFVSCPACRAEMPSWHRFCGACGGALGSPCPECGAPVPALSRFCGQCGAALTPSRGATPAAVPPPPIRETTPAPALPVSQDEERRRVAILFADLSGSTAMADRLEMETTFQVVSECIAGLARIATEGGGYVVKTLGDGLMAIFGAPVAHGDDPLRAGRAALRMQAWIREFAAAVRDQHDVGLTLRVGVNYGSVVAASLDTGGRSTFDVLGDAVNVAQRLESAAEPGTVCVSDSFYRITTAAFEYRDRGVARVKGKPEPLPLYELVAERELAEGLPTGFPLFGRERELALLRDAARRLEEGGAGVFALVGSPGIGKSRLLEELSGQLVESGLPVLRGIGRERSTPLLLWRTWVSELLALTDEMEWGEALERVRQALEETGGAHWAEVLTALAVDPARLRSMEGEQSDHALRAALVAFLRHWSGGRPAAVIVDEASLLDTLSLRLLSELGEAGGDLLVVTAGNSNTDFPAAGMQRLEIEPISPAAARAWLAGTLSGSSLPEEVIARAIERAGGNPLFLQVMLTAALEAADPADVLAAVPDSLYGLLRPQVDAMPAPLREFAQRAAVLGRQFPERWLQSVTGEPDHAVGTLVARMEREGLLIEQRPAPHRELAFRHGALQEVLYEGLLRGRRRELHALAAHSATAEAEAHPDLSATAAWHWTLAEEWPEAARWSLRAAHHASELFAGQEAVELFDRALELAERCGRTDWVAEAKAGQAEVALHRGDFAGALELFRCAAERLDLGATADWSLLGVTIALGEARVLGRTGRLAESLPVLEQALTHLAEAPEEGAMRALTAALIERAHVHRDLGLTAEAKVDAERALTIAQDQEWVREEASAGSALGTIYPRLGDWPSAERVLRHSVVIAEQVSDWKGAASCWINLGSGLQAAGRLGEATVAFERALDYAERIGDAEKTAIIRLDLGTIHLNRGDWLAAEGDYRSAVEQFRRMDHPLGVVAALCNLTDTLRWAGRSEEAGAVLRETEAALAAVDAGFLHVHLAVAQAEQHLAGGDLSAAREAAERGLILALEADYETGANLSRHTLGRVLRVADDLSEAERVLQEALAGFEGAGEALEAARTQLEIAAVLTASGREPEARGLQAEGTARLRQLGAEPWLAHAPL